MMQEGHLLPVQPRYHASGGPPLLPLEIFPGGSPSDLQWQPPWNFFNLVKLNIT